jgi:hypothetical protein
VGQQAVEVEDGIDSSRIVALPRICVEAKLSRLVM